MTATYLIDYFKIRHSIINAHMKTFRSHKTYVMYVGILFIGFVAGFCVFYLLNFRPVNSTETETRLKGSTFTSPLLACESNGPSTLTNIRRMKDKAEIVIKSQKNKSKVNRISVYFRDMNNGPWFGIDEDAEFAPASMLKLPVLIRYLKMSESDPTILERKLTVDTFNQEASPNIKPTHIVEQGKEYTVEHLLQYMIRYSDNNAKDALFDPLDKVSYVAMLDELGINTDPDPDEINFMSVKEYSSFFRILYNASYLNTQMSEKALEILSKTDFASGIVARIPKSVQVAHKFGERRYTDVYGNEITQLHDCGVVYHPHKPYLLCIMSQGTDFSELEMVIQLVSMEIYQSIE